MSNPNRSKIQDSKDIASKSISQSMVSRDTMKRPAQGQLTHTQKSRPTRANEPLRIIKRVRSREATKDGSVNRSKQVGVSISESRDFSRRENLESRMESSAFGLSHLKKDLGDDMSEISFMPPETTILTKDDVGKKDNPDEEICINLTESETFHVFHKMALAISTEEEKRYKDTKKLNKEQDENTKNRHAGDTCMSGEIQTVNAFLKKKKLQTQSVQQAEKAVAAQEWDIKSTETTTAVTKKKKPWDTVNNVINSLLQEAFSNGKLFVSEDPRDYQDILAHLDEKAPRPIERQVSHRSGEDAKKKIPLNTSQMKGSESETSTSIRNEASMSMVEGKEGEKKDDRKEEKLVVLNDEPLPTSLMRSMKIIERIIIQNKLHKQQILYKDQPTTDFKEIVKNMKDKNKDTQIEQQGDMTDQTLIPLFEFCPEQYKDRNVSSLCWNANNPDLLACAIGEWDTRSEGAILLMTLKNPQQPEQTIVTDSGIMSVAFSQQSPWLCAGGLYDGTVAIWDVRQGGSVPVASSRDLLRKDGAEKKLPHTDTVWEVKWTDKGDKGEGLVSISTDGFVKEWNIRKGLEFSDIMPMKTVPNPHRKKKRKEGSIFRQASGLSIDFCPKEPGMYLIATEDCTVHKCSTSLTESQVESYFGHQGPVYKVRCNPFLSSAFVSCSQDWTIKLWTGKDTQCKLDIRSSDLYSPVNDVEWSPYSSTVFGSVCKDGRIEIRDLKICQPEPIVKQFGNKDSTNVERTCLKFSESSPVLVTGKRRGGVDCFRVIGFDEDFGMNDENQAIKLTSIIDANEVKEVESNNETKDANVD